MFFMHLFSIYLIYSFLFVLGHNFVPKVMSKDVSLIVFSRVKFVNIFVIFCGCAGAEVTEAECV